MLLNIIVLLLEVLYYSLFMKFARKEGKLWRYLFGFSLSTIALYFINTNNIYSYLLFILMMIYSMKYIVKIKVSIYDMIFIIIMLLSKAILEHIIVLIFYVGLRKDILLTTLIFTIFKFLFILLFKNKVSILYNYLLIKWNNNNFYIRYLFTVFMFVYIIISIITILFY